MSQRRTRCTSRSFLTSTSSHPSSGSLSAFLYSSLLETCSCHGAKCRLTPRFDVIARPSLASALSGAVNDYNSATETVTATLSTTVITFEDIATTMERNSRAIVFGMAVEVVSPVSVLVRNSPGDDKVQWYSVRGPVNWNECNWTVAGKGESVQESSSLKTNADIVPCQ